MSEAKFGSDVIASCSTANAEPFISTGGNNSFVPDVFTFDPISFAVDQVGELTVRFAYS